MLITEILDQKVEFDVKVDTANEFTVDAIINDRVIRFTATDEFGQGQWDMVFGELKNKGRIDYKASGNGGELQVFSMVKSAIEMLIKKRKPLQIIFAADKREGNRVKLYTKMFTRFKVPGYTFEADNGDTYHAMFTLTKDD